MKKVTLVALAMVALTSTLSPAFAQYYDNAAGDTAAGLDEVTLQEIPPYFWGTGGGSAGYNYWLGRDS